MDIGIGNGDKDQEPEQTPWTGSSIRDLIDKCRSHCVGKAYRTDRFEAGAQFAEQAFVSVLRYYTIVRRNHKETMIHRDHDGADGETDKLSPSQLSEGRKE